MILLLPIHLYLNEVGIVVLMLMPMLMMLALKLMLLLDAFEASTYTVADDDILTTMKKIPNADPHLVGACICYVVAATNVADVDVA
jgi:hypothetical protein